MREKQQTLDAILDCGLAAVVRAESADDAMKAIDAVIAGGVNVVEVTFTVPGALGIISKIASNKPSDLVLGAGTVTTPQAAEDAIKAGAEFLVSPNTDIDVIEAAITHKVPMFPGALTPTEVLRAWQAGGDVIKIFPANVFGPSYFKDLHGPYPNIPFMPTGGVNLDTAKSWLEAGAVALGVGGALVDKKLIKAGSFAEITDRARKFREIIQEFRAK